MRTFSGARGSVVLLAVLALALGRPGGASAQPAPAPAREEQLEGRIRQLEALVKRMPDPDYVRRLEAKVQKLSDQVQQLQPAASASASASSTSSGSATGSSSAGTRPVTDVPDPIRGIAASAPFAAGAEDAEMPPRPRRVTLRSQFGEGFQWASSDDEFVLQYSNFTEVDGRVNLPKHQALVSDGINFPLAFNTLSARASRYVEGNLSFGSSFAQPGANGFKTVFAFITLPLDPRFNLRLGKQRLPFSYEFYLTPLGGLMNFEWSIFIQNYVNFTAPGFDAYGQLFDKRLTYSVGVYDDPQFGASRNILDYNDFYATKAALGLVDFQPFLRSEDSRLERFHVGGSFFAGSQQGGASPLPLVAGLNSYGIPFLAYNQDVRQSGPLAFWALSAAYFSGPLSLQAEWESGFQGLERLGHHDRTRLGIQSYYVQSACLLTGETVVARGMVKPLRPVDFRPGKFGLGAWEVAARFNPFEVGGAVFTQGLADPNLWTNRLWVLDLGVNWYWNEYLKISFGWKHAEFADPVFSHPGALQKGAQQFLVRALVTF